VPDTQRLFVGIDVGPAWTDRLSGAADDLRDALGNTVRWVRPELYHVTVLFLGDQTPKAVEEIGQAIRAAAAQNQPFELELDALHLLGGHERGALVAGVLDRSGRLQQTRANLDDELRRRRVRFDSKPLVPHITLARPRRRQGRIAFDPVDLSDAPPLNAYALTLVSSLLLPEGPKYTTLMKIGLGSR
jgi:RNA 2',3'-cyclic 3'-phosphodiesterase